MLTYRYGDRASRSGLDLVISLTPDQSEALGVDAAALAEALDTTLVGLAALRTGRDPEVPAGASLKDQPHTAGQLWDEWLIRDASTLLDRLAGVRAAAIRAHVDHGGTYGDLAAAMSVLRATAQRRRDTVTGAEPTPTEVWATTLPPTDRDDQLADSATANVADGTDVVAVQVSQTNANIRAGHARVDRQADTITGDINL